MNSKRLMKGLVYLLAMVMVFSLTACGNQPATGDTPPPAPSETEKSDTPATSPPADSPAPEPQPEQADNQFWANLEPQVIYDENEIKLTLEVVPDKPARTYQVTAVNGTDKTISLELGPVIVDGVEIQMGLINPETQIWDRYINPGETQVSEVTMQNLINLQGFNLYKDSGLGNIGDFDITIVLKDDSLELLADPKVVSVQTDRGLIKPDLSIVTKNLLVDKEGIKLYLVKTTAGEDYHDFLFFYENTHDKMVSGQSVVLQADGVEYGSGPSGMYFEMAPQSKGFYQFYDDDYYDAGVTDPKNFEAKFKFSDFETLNFETDLVSFQLDKFPPIMETNQ